MPDSVTTLSPGSPEALALTAASLRDHLLSQVHQIVEQAAQHLEAVTRNNPLSGAAAVLSRPDIARQVEEAAEQGREAARQAIDQAWAEEEAPGGQYLQALLADADRAWLAFPDLVAAAVRQAFEDHPQQHFQPGVSQPGSNPAMEAGRARAQAVREAVQRQGDDIAARNGLSVAVAGAAGRAAAILEEAQGRSDAGEQVAVEWVASQDGKDPRTCPWCRALHGHVVEPGQQFPHPQQIGQRKPPRVYQGVLFSPPLHPQCRCHLRLRHIGGGELPEPPPVTQQEQAFITSTSIKNMPAERYNQLTGFLRSALHELGQFLRRLRGG